MPIDTVNKRRSVSGYTNFPVYPVADAVIGAADREHTTWLYSGIAAGSPAPVTSGNICGVLVLPLVPTGQLFQNPIVSVIDASILDGVLAVTVKPSGEVFLVAPPIGQVSECDDA